jgi:hypothetical protein
LCPVPTRSDFITFRRLENLYVAMPAKAQTHLVCGQEITTCLYKDLF